MSVYKLPGRSFLRLLGLDALRYLSGQITQKVESLDDCVLWTTVTNAKGGVEGVGCVRRLSENEYLFDCPAELGDQMEARLDRYLIADDCEWFREDEKWTVLVSDESGFGDVTNRFRSSNIREKLVEGATDYPDLTQEVEDQWCTCYGVPRWGREILGGELPAEVGLYDLALSFDKGCYIGQEVISRMETSGRTRKKLYRIKGKGLAVTDPTSFFADGEVDYALLFSKKDPTGFFPDAEVKAF